jgi:DNA polymerase-3 subunit delta
MRIFPSLLAANLEKNLKPFYLLFGTEAFLIGESANLIRQKILVHGDVEHRILQIEQNNCDALLAEIEQPSLFSQIQLIEITLTKLNVQVFNILTSILQSPPEGTFFLIQAGKLSRANQQAKWFTHIEQTGVVIPHWPLNGALFSKWVAERAKRFGLTLPAQTLQQLIYYTEGNCLSAAQEIEKLCLTNMGTPTYFSQQSQFEVSDLCEAALTKQPARVIKIVSCLKESPTTFTLVIWALAQTIRTLRRCKGSSFDETMRYLQQAGIRAHQHDLYLRVLKESPISSWASLLPYIAQADKLFKTGANDDAWRHILDVSLQIAGFKSYSPNFI